MEAAPRTFTIAALRLGPDLVRPAPRLPFARWALHQVQPDRSLDRLDHVQQRDTCGGNRQGKTSAGAAPRADHPRTNQLLQDLRQKVSRNVGRLRQHGLPNVEPASNPARWIITRTA